jgi:hypothetical protein
MAEYLKEWHKPKSVRRKLIENLIMLSIVDLKDMGYRSHFTGWVKSSTYLSVWISTKRMGKEIDLSSPEIKNTILICNKIMDSFKIRMVKVNKLKYEINLLYDKE